MIDFEVLPFLSSVNLEHLLIPAACGHSPSGRHGQRRRLRPTHRISSRPAKCTAHGTSSFVACKLRPRGPQRHRSKPETRIHRLASLGTLTVAVRGQLYNSARLPKAWPVRQAAGAVSHRGTPVQNTETTVNLPRLKGLRSSVHR